MPKTPGPVRVVVVIVVVEMSDIGMGMHIVGGPALVIHIARARASPCQ